MLKNYIKIAFRNIVKRKLYSVISIIGLALGITSCILIMLYVKQELNYDRFHAQAARIYRLAVETTRAEGTNRTAGTPIPVAPAFTLDFPKVESVVRIYKRSDTLVRIDDNRFVEEGFIYADPDFFKMFSFSLVKGNPDNLLNNPSSIVISSSLAKKYFGDKEPINRILRVDKTQEYSISGVFGDIPANSHFHFQLVASFLAVNKEIVGYPLDQWGAFGDLYTYILLPEQMDIEAFSRRIEPFMQKHGDYPPGISRRLFLQPLTRIHLHSHLNSEIEPNNYVSNLVILSTIALLILIIACINYVNLATAISLKRAKEVGMRKVLGAEKKQLLRQFLGETVLLSLMALVLSSVLVELLLPAFSSMVGSPVDFNIGENIPFLMAVVLISIFVGITSGIYPAIFLSSYQPIKTLKSSREASRSPSAQVFLKKGLVVFQFIITIMLITGTLLINKQLHFLHTADLGFERNHVISLPIFEDQGFFNETVNKGYDTLKHEIKNHPGVLSATACLKPPISPNYFSISVYPEGPGGESRFSFAMNFVDYDFCSLFGLKFLAGRNFSPEFATDHRQAFILNETASRRLGYASPQDAIGKQVTIGINNLEGTVIGVTKDYHVASMHEKIEPVMLLYWPSLFAEIAVRIHPEMISTTLKHLEKTWNTFRPDFPFEFAFIDENVQELYDQEEQTSAIIRTFSFIAIFIACLGLFGLAADMIEKKTKEIGVRKVLGASVSNIMVMLSMEFTKWVLVANLVAWPLAYFALQRWLNGFEYKIRIGLLPFVLAALITFGIALVTVIYQAIKASVADPVRALRYE